MSLYELGMVLDPELDDQAREAFFDALRQLLGSQNAKLVKEEVWGKRKLAYPIRHKQEGYYVFWQFESAGNAVAPLEYKLRLSDEVLRFLTLNLDREMRRAKKMSALRAAQQATKVAKQEAGVEMGSVPPVEVESQGALSGQAEEA